MAARTPGAAVPRVGSRRNASILAVHAAARSHRRVGGRSAFGGRGAWEAEHAPLPRPPATAPRRRPSHMAARPPDRGAAQMTPWPITIGHRSAAALGRTTSGPNMSSPREDAGWRGQSGQGQWRVRRRAGPNPNGGRDEARLDGPHANPISPDTPATARSTARLRCDPSHTHRSA